MYGFGAWLVQVKSKLDVAVVISKFVVIGGKSWGFSCLRNLEVTSMKVRWEGSLESHCTCTGIFLGCIFSNYNLHDIRADATSSPLRSSNCMFRYPRAPRRHIIRTPATLLLGNIGSWEEFFIAGRKRYRRRRYATWL